MKPSALEKAESRLLGPWQNRWTGRTVVVIGSGPSLTLEDVEKVRHFPALVTNTTFRTAPWAEVLVGFDVKWWNKYGDEVQREFPGDLVTCARGARAWPRMHCFAEVPWLASFRNSGAVAVALAVYAGASRVLMIGFDCQRTDGKTHHHGDHPKGLGNAMSIKDWPKCFAAVAHYARGKSEILNCSRVTALTCFPRMSLEGAL